MWTRGGRTRLSFCWMLSGMRCPPLLGLVLDPEGVAELAEHVLARDDVLQPFLEGHLAPPDGALDEVRDGAVGLRPPEELRDGLQPAERVGTVPRLDRDRARRGRRRHRIGAVRGAVARGIGDRIRLELPLLREDRPD